MEKSGSDLKWKKVYNDWQKMDQPMRFIFMTFTREYKIAYKIETYTLGKS